MAEQSPVGADELRLHLLVLRCQAGDERAFAQLFGQFGGKTRAYLGGLVGESADDVQQDVWLAVYRGIRTLSKPQAFRTWLYRTTRHRAIDFLRRRKREQELFVAAEPDALEASAATEVSETALDASMLAAALGGLPTVQREVLLLRYQDELSYAEISLVVGCSIGTVRSRLHHAKRRMQELIESSR